MRHSDRVPKRTPTSASNTQQNSTPVNVSNFIEEQALEQGIEGASPRLLTQTEFHGLASVPAEVEWFANIDNLQTRRAYQNDLREFMAFVGIRHPEEFRIVTRSHVIAWRKTLEERQLASSTIRRKLTALASLFEYLCESNAVPFNPVKGAKRPKVETYEGKTPALGNHQARSLLDSPDTTTIKGMRDRAILSMFLYHGLRRAELCSLRVRDIHVRRGAPHIRVHGKKGTSFAFYPCMLVQPNYLMLISKRQGTKKNPVPPCFKAYTVTTSKTASPLTECARLCQRSQD